MKILFVCHGNICRSVAAEMILKSLDVDNKLYISSCATSSEEIGNSIYPPVKKVLMENNIKIEEHYARKLKFDDGLIYDYIIGMDNANIYNIKRIIGEDKSNKVFLLNNFLGNDKEIDDPWYTRKFDLCYKELYEGCKALYEYLLERM